MQRRTGTRIVCIAIIASLLTLGVLPACSVFEAEVGDPVTPCVDVDSDPANAVSFKTQIRPIMNGDVAGPRPCANCHYTSRGTHEGLDLGHLNLETLGELRKGGINSGTGIAIPGKPCSSALVQKLKGTFEGPRMPKGGPYWSPEQIQLVIDWIAEGAKGDDAE